MENMVVLFVRFFLSVCFAFVLFISRLGCSIFVARCSTDFLRWAVLYYDFGH